MIAGSSAEEIVFILSTGRGAKIDGMTQINFLFDAISRL